MVHLMISNIEVRQNILDDDKFKYIFSVEEVNRLVLEGVPFRDAYRKVGFEIENGTYNPPRNVEHSHEGSIGNLKLAEIRGMMEQALSDFRFEARHEAIRKLLGE